MENKPTVQYIDSLTPLRGIAALMVLFFHFNEGIRFTSDFQKNFIPNEMAGLLYKSYLWVDFFFLLSGFVIYHVYGQRYFGEKVTKGRYRDFIVARLARIYPLHVALLLFLILLQILTLIGSPENAFKGSNSLSSLPAEFLMLDSIGLFDYLTWNFVSWSISAEWLAYLIFPFFFPFFKTNKPWVYVGLIGLSWAGLFLITAYHPNQNLDATYDLGFVRGGLGFLAGIAVYKLYRQGTWRQIFASDWTFLLSLVWILTFLILDQHDLLVVAGFVPLLLSAANNEGRPNRVLNVRPLTLLGDISYSLYMWQGPLMGFYFMTIFMGITPEVYGGQYGFPQYLVAFLLFCGTAVLLSLLTYYKVEIPWRRRIRRWWGSRQTAPEA